MTSDCQFTPHIKIYINNLGSHNINPGFRLTRGLVDGTTCCFHVMHVYMYICIHTVACMETPKKLNVVHR